MKHSIKTIFKNLTTVWIFISFIMAIGALTMMGENISFSKINNLNNQKNIISTLMKFDSSDLGFTQIHFNGKSSEILIEIDKLRDLSAYDFIGQYIIDNSSEYISDLDELAKLTITLNEKASSYYVKELKNKDLKFQELRTAFDNINNHINSIILKIISYEEIKFHIFEKIYILAFIIIFFTTIWFGRRLSVIYKDILFLFAVNSGKNNHEIFSEEVDAISLRMKKKPLLSDDPSLIDNETGVHNLKGLFSAYSEKRNLKYDNVTSVTILEIDNFSRSNQMFSEEIAQTILKNIAFSISLHEQATDIIARNEYNQFTIVFSRPSKEKSLKEIDAIRQSIAEIKFVNKNGEKTQITVSGGFIIKNEATSLENTMNMAKKALQQAIGSGGNKISQATNLMKYIE